jgi:hypothetical protein
MPTSPSFQTERDLIGARARRLAGSCHMMRVAGRNVVHSIFFTHAAVGRALINEMEVGLRTRVITSINKNFLIH